MNPYLAMGIGVAAGSVATFFATKEYYKKYYNDIYEEELNSVKKSYAKCYEKIKKHKEIEDAKEKYSKIIFENEYVNEDEEKETAEEDEDIEKDRIFPEEESDTPFSITPKQFVIEKDYYDKVTVSYYEKDETFVDETDPARSIIDNPTYLFGTDIQFGEFEEDVAYIRNDRISTDFEIICNHSAYSDGEDY